MRMPLSRCCILCQAAALINDTGRTLCCMSGKEQSVSAHVTPTRYTETTERKYSRQLAYSNKGRRKEWKHFAHSHIDKQPLRAHLPYQPAVIAHNNTYTPGSVPAPLHAYHQSTSQHNICYTACEHPNTKCSYIQPTRINHTCASTPRLPSLPTSTQPNKAVHSSSALQDNKSTHPLENEQRQLQYICTHIS